MQIANYKANGELITSAGSGGSGITELTGDVTAGPGSGSVAATLVSGTNAALTRPRITTSIDDSAGNEIIKTPATASAVNEITITNAAAGSGVTISTTGGDTDIDLLLVAKGAGVVKADGVEVVTLSGNQTLTNKTLTTPRIGTSVNDTGGNEILSLTATASAVNNLAITNAAAGGTPQLSAVGDDTDISIDYNAKGTGRHIFEQNVDLNDKSLLKTLYTDLKAAAAPSNPSAGYIRVYADSGNSNHVTQRDSAGTVIDLASSGSGTTETGNFMKNASFENWENGVSAAPDSWAITGASATVAREGTIIKHGLYSAKLTRAGADATLVQDIYVPGGSTFVRSRQYTFGAWVYATVASRVRLRIDDGVTVTNSSYHTGGSAWEWLSVTATLGAAITVFKVGLQVDTGDTSGYIDGIAITEAATLTAGFYPSIMPFNAFPQRAVMWHEDALVTAGNALATSHDTAQNYAHYFTQNTPADLDTFTQSFWLRAGTYTFSAIGLTLSNAGKIDWYIDEVTITTGQDWYSAGLTYNVTKTVGSVAVIGDGYHVLKGKVNGKNGSSSSYFMPLTKYWFTPSAD